MPKIAKNYGNVAEADNDSATRVRKATKRIRYSVFMITWNSNKSFADLNDPDFKELELRAEKYWESTLDNIIDYIIIKKDGDNSEKIKTVSTDAGFEIGGEKRCFHAHMYVRVDHYTSVKLDVDRLRKEIAETIAPGGWISVKATADSTKTMQDYIHKNA